MSDGKVHARLSPSASNRWLNCQGSIRFIDELNLAPRKSNPQADFGTRTHQIAEKIVDKMFDGEGVPDTLDDDNEETQLAKVYARVLEEDVKGLGANATFVSAVEYETTIVPDYCFGTADAVLFHGGILRVYDLKTGRELPSATDNTQLLIYAMGVAEKLAADKKKKIAQVELVIVGPRFNSVDRWRMPISEFNERKTEIRKKIDSVIEILDADDFDQASLVAGDHCEWCPAAAKCPAIRTKSYEVAQLEFDDAPAVATLPAPTELTQEQLIKILKHAKAFRKWLDAIDDHATELAQSGTEIDGFKLVEKRTNRQWNADPAKIASRLCGMLKMKRNEVMTRELKSPTKILELVKDKEKRAKIERWIEKPAGESTLVPEDDKRPAIANEKK